MNEEFVSSLMKIGLSENEAKVYLTCLELGPSAIWDIAKKSGVKRPTCYVLLEELTKKGIAKCHKDPKRVTFSVISPKQLAVIESQRHSQFIQILPQLDGLASSSSSKPKISMFEGEIGIMEVYNLMIDLPPKTEILSFFGEEIKVNYQEFIDQFKRVRAVKNISCRLILPDTFDCRQIGLRDPLELRETRFLPVKNFDQKTEVNIFGDTVIYIAHSSTEPFATMIESSRLAKEERQRFELLWQMAEK